jgi:hypothetical protein
MSTSVYTGLNAKLNTFPLLHFNRCLTEYSETTAYFNSNFDNDNQIYRSLSAQRLSERTGLSTQCVPRGKHSTSVIKIRSVT